MAQYKGRVQWFNNAKGYGFLQRESGPDVFVHYSGVEADGYKTLSEGEEVEFDIVIGDKGKEQAANVRKLEGNRPPPAISGASMEAAAD